VKQYGNMRIADLVFSTPYSWENYRTARIALGQNVHSTIMRKPLRHGARRASGKRIEIGYKSGFDDSFTAGLDTTICCCQLGARVADAQCGRKQQKNAFYVHGR
jgi:hypothetical protein